MLDFNSVTGNLTISITCSFSGEFYSKLQNLEQAGGSITGREMVYSGDRYDRYSARAIGFSNSFKVITAYLAKYVIENDSSFIFWQNNALTALRKSDDYLKESECFKLFQSVVRLKLDKLIKINQALHAIETTLKAPVNTALQTINKTQINDADIYEMVVNLAKENSKLYKILIESSRTAAIAYNHLVSTVIGYFSSETDTKVRTHLDVNDIFQHKSSVFREDSDIQNISLSDANILAKKVKQLTDESEHCRLLKIEAAKLDTSIQADENPNVCRFSEKNLH